MNEVTRRSDYRAPRRVVPAIVAAENAAAPPRRVGRPRKVLPWQEAYIRKAAKIRRLLTNKSLAKRLGISDSTVTHYIVGRHRAWGLTEQQTSHADASMTLMKAAEHGFEDGDHLIIDGHEYSSLEVREALFFARATLDDCMAQRPQQVLQRISQSEADASALSGGHDRSGKVVMVGRGTLDALSVGRVDPGGSGAGTS
jgi:hypothetical protein